jgi:GNAT superfamily N-acetyltransferase
MDDQQLARLEHANMVEALAVMGSRVSGALVDRRDGMAIIATGLPVYIFNQVLVDGDDAPKEALADRVRRMRDLGASFVVNLRTGVDDDLLEAVEAQGLVPMSAEPWMPGMALHPLPPAGSAPAPGGHEIRRVTDDRGIADHITAAAAGFGMPAEWLEMVMTAGFIADPAVTAYVGYTDGVPVSAGLGLRVGPTVGVFNVATIEPARGRGYGAAMTMRIVDDGAAAGCQVATLQASDMAKPIYERLGFRTVVEYMGYVDPAPTGGTEVP